MQNVTEDRWKFIGGSDIPAIMNISPFKDYWSLLREKAQLIEPDFEGNAYTEYGNVMEEKIREYVNEFEGIHCVEDKRIDGDLRYHADGWDDEKKVLLEIKTTSQVGEELDDYKPYKVQTILGWQMFEARDIIIAVYERPEDWNEEFDPFRLQIFHYTPSWDEIHEVNEAIEIFRERLERLRKNPNLEDEDLLPDRLYEVARRVELLEQQIISLKEAEAEKKELMPLLKGMMEEYNIKTWTTSEGYKITLVPDTPSEEKWERKFNEQAFKEENAEMYESYCDDVRTVKKGKAGYVRITKPKGA